MNLFSTSEIFFTEYEFNRVNNSQISFWPTVKVSRKSVSVKDSDLYSDVYDSELYFREYFAVGEKKRKIIDISCVNCKDFRKFTTGKWDRVGRQLFYNSVVSFSKGCTHGSNV